MREVLLSIKALGESRIEYMHYFEEVVGYSSCVPTYRGDDIVFAHRVGRDRPSRFVRNRRAEPTRIGTVVLELNGDETSYLVRTAHLGPLAPIEPWGLEAPSPESIRFWNHHAFAWGSEPVAKSTVTSALPRRLRR